MRRRAVLKILGAVAAGALPSRGLHAALRDRIGVVGAGILGTSVAHALARRGASVTLFERNAPASGTTGRSFAWLNAHFSKRPQAYYQLNHLGVLAWRELEDQLGSALGLQWGGAVEWTLEPEPDRELRDGVQWLQRCGSSTRLIDADELVTLEPRVVPGPVRSASYAEQEGAVDAVAATLTLLTRARVAGAKLLAPCDVTAIDVREGRLHGVQTSRGYVELDRLVLTAGVETARLATQVSLEVPLTRAPGLIVHTTPMPRLLDRVVVAPLVHVRQALDGRVVVGEDPGPPKDDTHRHLALDTGNFSDEALRARHAIRLLASAARFVPALEPAAVQQLLLGWRPLPQDGHPVIGPAPRCQDVYVAVTHSGITLAPLLGRLAAMEILDGVRTDLLEPYRPDRF